MLGCCYSNMSKLKPYLFCSVLQENWMLSTGHYLKFGRVLPLNDFFPLLHSIHVSQCCLPLRMDNA